jgi:hypothetical protein
MVLFYGAELLATNPNPKVQNHKLSAFPDCYSIFPQRETNKKEQAELRHKVR